MDGDTAGGVTLRDYLERILNERHAQYEVRFKASETAVAAALAAQKDATASAFASNEKAIATALDAQREYNVRSNEFRGQLDDQAKTLMPRTESIALSRAQDEKIELIRREIASLRESRSAGEGKGQGATQGWGWAAAVVFLVVAVLAVVSRFAP